MRVAEFYLLPDCNNNRALGTEPLPGGGISLLPRTGAEAEQPTLLAQPLTNSAGHVRLYDESCDSWSLIGYDRLLEQCQRFIRRAAVPSPLSSAQNLAMALWRNTAA